MQNKKYKKRTSKRRYKVIALVVILLIVAGAVGWKLHHDSESNSTVKLSPSAKKEQVIGQQQAEQKGTTGSAATGSSSSTVAPKGTDSGGSGSTQTASGNVTPSITYPAPPQNGKPQTELSNSVEVDAFIPGILENGGTCTLTLSPASGGMAPVKATNTALLNGQTTRCQNFYIASSKISTGTWTAVVSYSSSAYQGTSAVVSFIIN